MAKKTKTQRARALRDAARALRAELVAAGDVFAADFARRAEESAQALELELERREA